MKNEYHGLNLTICRNPQILNERWDVRDRNGHLLGHIETRTLGAKLPLFHARLDVMQDGISSDFLFEIATIMTVIMREEMSTKV